jgi:hypothetical protein
MRETNLEPIGKRLGKIMLPLYKAGEGYGEEAVNLS